MRLLLTEVDIFIYFKDNSQQTTDNGLPSGVMGKGKVERGELREERLCRQRTTDNGQRTTEEATPDNRQQTTDNGQ